MSTSLGMREAKRGEDLIVARKGHPVRDTGSAYSSHAYLVKGFHDVIRARNARGARITAEANQHHIATH